MSSLPRRAALAAPLVLAAAAGSAGAAAAGSAAAAPAAGRRAIAPTDAAYAQAMEVTGARRLLFVGGQTPVDADDAVPGTFREQALLTWANVAAQLKAADMTVANIVKFTIFLSDRRYRGEAYETRREVLGDHAPAMTIVICGIYREEWLLEIEAIAAD